MATGTDDPKDLGSKKINNEEKQSPKNEGFSGENLPKNYDPSQDKMKQELEKNEEGETETTARARDVDEKRAVPVTESDRAENGNGKIVDKNRGTANEAEDMETAENRDFNSDIDEERYPADHPDNKKVRGNTHFGE
ncbi:hypothetical protein [Flavobacterium coralii]|uniref:hypothetical protein n=1 Tax=Flavobacterium coralii TaxID=2838017 RepID=UPI000C53BA87|nr:hypothetical protein [Flavobacterium sp.]|tara:strand:+ start:34798 stop:35208 length:411 start_codon:yes stop_codon:yes gene_type:complete